jgi:dCMP deaminase
MPVIHKTYLELLEFEEYDALFLIEPVLAIELVPALRKDLRAVEAYKICDLLTGNVKKDQRRYIPKYTIIDTETAHKVAEDFDNFILPEEDVSLVFAEKFLRDKVVEYRNVFLRYDSKRTTEPFVPTFDEIVTSSEFAKRMIARCDNLAQKSPDWWRQIGGLIVKDGQVIEELQMFNQAKPFGMAPYELGDPRSNFKKGLKPELTLVLHVEQGLVSEAARLGISLEGADLFVSTFPCPWCATAVAYSGIKHVFYHDGYAMQDGEEILKINNVELIRVVDNE